MKGKPGFNELDFTQIQEIWLNFSADVKFAVIIIQNMSENCISLVNHASS